MRGHQGSYLNISVHYEWMAVIRGYQDVIRVFNKMFCLIFYYNITWSSQCQKTNFKNKQLPKNLCNMRLV